MSKVLPLLGTLEALARVTANHPAAKNRDVQPAGRGAMELRHLGRSFVVCITALMWKCQHTCSQKVPK
jgi:hypothetical protein